MAKGNSNPAMSNPVIEEIVRQLMTGKPVCVCKPFCGHWEAHAAKVLSKYFPSSPPDPPRHHKNCAIWTVTRDGDKNACACGVEMKRFKEHLEYASKLAATWEPWERHILSSAPCGVDTCPCQHVAKKREVLCRCGSAPEVKWISGSYPEPDDHCPEGSWVVRCTSSACGCEYFGLTRNDAIDYWNSQQIDVEPYPFGRVDGNETGKGSKQTERNQWYGREFCPHPDKECIDGCSFCGAKLKINDHNHTLQERNPDKYECVCFNC